MRIALVCIYPDSNKGACALTWASVELVTRACPEAEVALVPFTVTPPDPAPFRHTARRYPHLTILPSLFDGEERVWPAQLWRLAQSLLAVRGFARHRRHANATLEWLRGCDLVVAGGGVIFHTCTGTLRNDASLAVRMLPLLAAQRIGIPTVLVGQQLGPFKSWFGRWLSRRILARAAAAFPRDRTSAAELDGLDLRGRATSLPDSALALSFPPRGDGPWEGRGLDFAVPTLALAISRTLRAEEGNDVHVALFAHLARGLLAAGVVQRVVVVLQTDEDEAISRALATALALDPHCYIDDDLDAEQLSNLYGACRLVVSSRMHGVLLALLSGVVAISVAPEVTFKERAVLEFIGLEALCVPSQAGAERALQACLAIATDEPRQRQAIATAIAAARARWDLVPEELRRCAVAARGAARLEPA